MDSLEKIKLYTDQRCGLFKKVLRVFEAEEKLKQMYKKCRSKKKQKYNRLLSITSSHTIGYFDIESFDDRWRLVRCIFIT